LDPYADSPKFQRGFGDWRISILGAIMIGWYWLFMVGGIGLALGVSITERRWKGNADDYRLIESGGRLYKVSYDE